MLYARHPKRHLSLSGVMSTVGALAVSKMCRIAKAPKDFLNRLGALGGLAKLFTKN
jgi:hypothetical protein